MTETREPSLVEKPDRKTHQVVLDNEETAGLNLLREAIGFRQISPTIRAVVKFCIELHKSGKLISYNRRFRLKGRTKEVSKNASEPVGD